MCVQGTNPRQTAIPTHQSRLQGQPFRNGKVRASPCNRFQGAEGRGSLAQVILVTTIYSQRAQTWETLSKWSMRVSPRSRVSWLLKSFPLDCYGGGFDPHSRAVLWNQCRPFRTAMWVHLQGENNPNPKHDLGSLCIGYCRWKPHIQPQAPWQATQVQDAWPKSWSCSGNPAPPVTEPRSLWPLL